MVDPDRDRDTHETRDTRDTTTIIERDGDRGGGGVLSIVLLLIVVLVLLFLFRDQLGFGGGDTTQIDVPEQIDVNIN